MNTHATIPDVYVSYSLADKPFAEKIKQALVAADLDVFDPNAVEPGSTSREAIRSALASCEVLILVLPRGAQVSANSIVEFGAAWGWDKQVYVIAEDNVAAGQVPKYLARHRVYTASRMKDVADAIWQRRNRSLLTKDERALLAKLYGRMGIPTDRYVGDPAARAKLAHSFNAGAGKSIPDEWLVSELIKMRKSGALASFASKSSRGSRLRGANGRSARKVTAGRKH